MNLSALIVATLKQIPPSLRKYVYLGLFVAAVAAGGTQVAFSSLGGGEPAWLKAALDVLAYVGGLLGLVAHANTNKE